MPAESVADIVRRLRFVSSSAPAIYLNEQFVKQMFVSQLGAIESFTRTAARAMAGEAGAGGFVKVGGSISGTTQIDYDLKEPLTQALVLHSALGSEGRVSPVGTDLARGTFIEAIGEAYLPDLGIHQHPLIGLDDTLAALEAERDRQQQVMRAFGDTNTVLTPLLIKSGSALSASVINRGYISEKCLGAFALHGKKTRVARAEVPRNAEFPGSCPNLVTVTTSVGRRAAVIAGQNGESPPGQGETSLLLTFAGPLPV